MIRYINCFRKLPDMSVEDFRDYWQGAEFGDLVRRVATLTGARRYNRSLTLQVSMAQSTCLAIVAWHRPMTVSWNFTGTTRITSPASTKPKKRWR